jgi:hypothetical protein
MRFPIFLVTMSLAVVSYGNDPLDGEQTASYIGTVYSRPGHYDLKPKVVVHENGFELVHFGQFRDGENDLPPFDDSLQVGDRIYRSFTANLNGAATQWQSLPTIVYKGHGGLTGQPECDDHLVGSPARFDWGGDSYMLVEAYGNWITRIVRTWDGALLDSWTTASETDQNGQLFENDASYQPESQVDLGFAPRYKVAGTHPVYAGEMWYWHGKRNRYLSLTPLDWSVDDHGISRPLNDGLPVFFLYSSPGEGRQPLQQFWTPYWDTFVSHANSFDGGIPGSMPAGPVIGYSATTLTTPDTTGCLLNRIRLLKYDSAIGHWIPVHGLATGGAMVGPLNESLAQWPHNSPEPLEALSPSRYYGMGFPVICSRDGTIEVYFTDDSRFDRARGNTALTRITLEWNEFNNPVAWSQANANAQECLYYVSDIKWSPRHQRYFAYHVKGNKPELRWSPKNPNPALPPVFPEENSLEIDLPEGIVAGWGGLSGTTQGQLDERDGYIPVHILFEQYRNGDTSYPNSEIGHALVFLWD